MPLIVAIEPDRRQAAQLSALGRGPLRGAQLVVAGSTARAIAVLGGRVPDLILISALLSPKDEEALADRLRELDEVAAHVQTLTIPVLAAPRRTKNNDGVLSRLRRPRTKAATPDGCDPRVFAEQVAEYLRHAAAERERAAAEARLDEEEMPIAAAPPVRLAVVEREPERATEPIAIEAEPIVSESDPIAIEFEALVSEMLQVEPELNTEESEPEPESTPDSELWMALSLGAHGAWPRLDGVFIKPAEIATPPEPEEPPAAIVIAPEAPVAMLAKATIVAPPEAAVEPARPEWAELLDALRHDLDRMQTARVVPVAAPAAAPSAPVAADASADEVEPPSATRKKKRKKTQPVQDEWGFFDPEQCGFAALVAKLDEVADPNEKTRIKRRA
jgi:hypothetical protein